jgi:hypothetical protein
VVRRTPIKLWAGIIINNNNIEGLDFVEVQFRNPSNVFHQATVHSQIKDNIVKGNLVLWKFYQDRHGISVTSNTISGWLEYYPVHVNLLSENNIENTGRTTINLTYNKVEGYGRVILPKEGSRQTLGSEGDKEGDLIQKQSIKLSGSSFADRLIIEKEADKGAPSTPELSNHWAFTKDEMRHLIAKVSKNKLSRRNIHIHSDENSDCRSYDGRYNEGEEQTDDIIIYLDQVKTASLVWQTSEACHRWRGRGLRYDFWGEPTLAQGHSRGFSSGMDIWLKYLSVEETPDAYSYAAEYASKMGEFTHSRDLRELAKRIDYTPRWISKDFSCLDPTEFCIGPNWYWLVSSAEWLRFGLLWPAGFGAKPERALLWLLMVFIVFGVVYETYSKHYFRNYAYLYKSNQSVEQHGFIVFDAELQPQEFSTWRYSLDVSLPVINFHAYERYMPEATYMRFITIIHHIIAWYLLTVFLAAAAIL